MPFNNPERQLESQRAYRARNLKKIQGKHKEYNDTHRSEINIKNAKARKNNPDYFKAYRADHKPEMTQHRANYRHRKMATDPSFKITQSLRVRIRQALKNGYKSAATITLLGCTIEEFRIHLEAQFKPGMSWDNYGKWHVDHIRPCASFDLSDPEQQRECFNYKNLQPLWAIDNFKKGAKYGITA